MIQRTGIGTVGRFAVATATVAVAVAAVFLLTRGPGYVKVPSQALAVVTQFAQADGNAQAVASLAAQRASAHYVELAESDPGRVSLASSAVGDAVGLIDGDRRLARNPIYVASSDAAHVEVSQTDTAARAGKSLTFVATITLELHDHGTPGLSDFWKPSSPYMNNSSGSALPYAVTIIRTHGGRWLLSAIKRPLKWECPPNCGPDQGPP